MKRDGGILGDTMNGIQWKLRSHYMCWCLIIHCLWVVATAPWVQALLPVVSIWWRVWLVNKLAGLDWTSYEEPVHTWWCLHGNVLTGLTWQPEHLVRKALDHTIGWHMVYVDAKHYWVTSAVHNTRANLLWVCDTDLDLDNHFVHREWWMTLLGVAANTK